MSPFRTIPLVLPALALLLLAGPLAAQGGPNVQAALYTRVDGATIRAAVEVEIAPGWHIYHSELGNPEAVGQPTTVDLGGEGILWGAAVFPAPEEIDQGFPGKDGKNVWIWGHEGTIVLYAAGTLAGGAGGADATASLSGLACEMSCVPWSLELRTQGRGSDALFAAFPAADRETAAGPGAGAGATAESTLPRNLWLFLLACIGGGLFALVMPCTYPMIPITISFFTKQAAARRRSVLPLALLYGAGIVLIFVLIGVFLGAPIIEFASHEITNLVIGLLFVYFSFVLFGVILLQPPRLLMKAVERAQTTGGLLGVFLMGATLVVSSFTCTAPIMGTLLALGGADGDLPRLVLGMAVFGLTMAVPFVGLSLVPGRLQALPRSGEWMNTLKFFLGFVELAAAFKFISNADVKLHEGPRWLPRDVFLGLWGVLFLLAALYLFGWIFRHGGGRAGTIRRGSGVLALAFAGYSFYGAAGRPLDYVMTAIAPPFSTAIATWPLFADDYDGALAAARAEGRLLLVNFTGHT
ncbi:MAG: cytochrome c biogenesis protein CcdA [Planctomycetota bacterium]